MGSDRDAKLWVWLLWTVVLDLGQFLVFPCSSLPLVSFALGVPTFGAIVAIPILRHSIVASESLPAREKPVRLALLWAALLPIALFAGFLLLITHMAS